MRACAGCWPSRALTSSAPRSRCFTRCSVGIARISLVIARSTCRVPMDELQRRDSKGIYAEAERGEVARRRWPRCASGDSGDARSGPRQLWRARSFNRGRPHPGSMRQWDDGVGGAPRAGARRLQDKGGVAGSAGAAAAQRRVLPQVRFSVGDWRSDCAACLLASPPRPGAADGYRA